MSLLQPPRLLSNKENTLLSTSYLPTTLLPAGSSKPGLSGLGRSPRKRVGGHSPKPYSRSASVHKPATKANAKKHVPPPLELAAKVARPVKPEIVSVRSQVDIPLTLSCVDIPLVPHLDDEFDPEIPFEYVRSRLLPRLAAFGIVSSQYRPYPTFPAPPSTADDLQPRRATMAFGVPGVVEGKDRDGYMASRLKGREPDLCLSITKKNDTASTSSAPASLVPVNKLVFASQCYHWSRLTEPSSPPLPSKQAPAASPANDLQTIKEEEDELASSGDDEADVNSSAPTSTYTVRTAEAPIIHLPIQPLALPSPETYSHLHNLLHFTHSPPPSTFSPLSALLEMDVSGLHKLDDRVLMRKLSVIQGVWKNCCYLGVGDARIWNAMRDAWGAVVGIVAERSKKVHADKMDIGA